METKQFINDLIESKKMLSVIGLGYVGLPIAHAFSGQLKVVGFDINSAKIALLKRGIDPTKELGDEVLKTSKIMFSDDPTLLNQASFHIVAVPTPINSDKTPDLSPLKSASKLLGKHLEKGSIVVFESTVYPGVTEDICVPILEEVSGLKCGVDFKVGYSPERINPGDHVHRLETITKVVSGMDESSLDIISKVYELIIEAGIYQAESIKVAEAAKVIENAQRDINIAFVNELSMIFNKLGIDTLSVLEAAGTKWNFLPFRPGLVGGHCIGIDPYYLTYKAQEVGYHSQVILSGRKINDDMGKYVVQELVKKMILNDLSIKTAKVGIFGFTFKENCPDVRNTRVIDIIHELKEYGNSPLVCDPEADSEEALNEYGIHFSDLEDMKDLDVVIFAVAHQTFKNNIQNYLLNNSKAIIFDIKGIAREFKNSDRYINL